MGITTQSSNNRWLDPGEVLGRPTAGALSSLHVAILLSLALCAALWGETFIFGGQGVQFQRYLALLGFYGVSSAVFVGSRIRRAKLQLFEIPVYITVMFFFQFGLIPLRNFIDPTQIDKHLSANGGELVQALASVILGMTAFWIGCELLPHKEGNRNLSNPLPQSTVLEQHRAGVLLAFVGLYVIGFITKIYLLRNHLYSYTTSVDEYYGNLASVQVLNYVSQFGTLALIVVTIERYRRGQDRLWRALFVAVLISEVFWGLISGMKSLVLQNFLVVALLSSYVLRRLNLRWYVILFLGLVLIYPFVNAYRAALNSGDVEVTSFGRAADAGQIALSTVEESGSTAGDLWREGFDRALERLDLLTSVAQVLSLESRASMVKGDVQWWMLPFYPFIPRLLWPSKPILNESARFTAALGNGNVETVGSATAVTYPGDLYLQFGLLGVPIGMFVLGVVTQWFTSRVSRSIESRDLFLYAATFLFAFPYEVDVFDFWATFIKVLAILYVVRLVVYGLRKRV